MQQPEKKDKTKELPYPFLKVFNEKEAIVMGINPTNNYQHVLLRKIREKTSIQNAAKGTLFQINEVVLDKMKITMENTLSSLNRLIISKLIAHLVCFQLDVEEKLLYTRSFFITNPPELSRTSVADIYEELIRYSFAEIKNWYEIREDLDADNFRNELEWQFNAKKGGNFSIQMKNVFNPFKALRDIPNNVKLSEEMVSHMGGELSRRLLDAHMGIQIPGHGLLVLRDNEVLDHFEPAAQFFFDTVLPPSKADPIFKYKLDKIDLEEKSYYMSENFPIETCRFIVMKAKEFQNFKKEMVKQKGLPTYPGSLAVETIINLETLVEKKYQEIWQEQQEKSLQEFKRGMDNVNGNWTKLVRFIDDEESFSYSPELWHDLINDKDLFYTSWESSNSSFHVFTSSNEQVVNAIVLGITTLPPKDNWKLAAVKTLVQEKQLQLKSLFSDSSFVQSFHKLQKKVYIDYLPWYKKILVIVSLFEERMFNDAGKKLEEEQKNLSRSNKVKKKAIIERINHDKSMKIAEIKENALQNSIEDTLDVYYFTQKKVPSVAEIKNYYPDFEMQNFIRTLKDYNFKLVAPESKEFPETSILLYPQNRSWKDRKLKLRRTYLKLQDGYKNSFKHTPDPVQVDRVSKLMNFLDRK